MYADSFFSYDIKTSYINKSHVPYMIKSCLKHVMLVTETKMNRTNKYWHLPPASIPTYKTFDTSISVL